MRKESAGIKTAVAKATKASGTDPIFDGPENWAKNVQQ